MGEATPLGLAAGLALERGRYLGLHAARTAGGRVRAYYNEFDPFAAAWLREAIRDDIDALCRAKGGA